MIVFQPIGYRDYKRLHALEFKKIPCELIERGDFKLYFNDNEAHRAAELEGAENQEWDYIGYVIQYFLEDDYIAHLKRENNIDESIQEIARPLIVPAADTDIINDAMFHHACVAGFYYNAANKFSNESMPIEEIRRMQILQYYTKWDPAGLIEIGAPRDEYYYEIREICNRIDQNTSTEELAVIIEEVTRKAFGNMHYIKDANILDIAKKIDSFIK